MQNKGVQAAVFFEQGLDVSTQVRGSIKIAKISYETFDSKKELYQLAFGHCLKTLVKLYWYL